MEIISYNAFYFGVVMFANLFFIFFLLAYFYFTVI
ncbi:hypothetical protein SAMN06265220_104352 [Flavobacterium nitrogenifigens]|uniref:Uncharacterized protein n=1 Tax=Flavobacterium nitrogenifigens TaxID=1617283 RepID=A0A521EK53_9FLAO|nr:hypothetical protein SAMN06265220_104352 [Flavobacterium nitrogenifigens]